MKNIIKKLGSLLEDNKVSISDFGFGDFENSFKDLLVANFGNYEWVKQAERTEGYGDYDGAQSVYHFTEHDIYVSVEGSYHSDDGIDWDDLRIVEPKTIQTVIYNLK